MSEKEWTDFSAAIAVTARKSRVNVEDGSVRKGAAYRARRRDTVIEECDGAIVKLVKALGDDFKPIIQLVYADE